MTDEELRKIAGERAQAKVGFYIHLIVYVVINALLVSIWYFITGPSESPWFIYPMVGWGIALVIHAITAFRGGGSSLEDRMTEKELAKLKAERAN
jgi:hypothetical protein